MPKISIILPVYNVERYLDECINSVLIQSFTDFELILVDDGSIDGSLSICKKYRSEDNRVIVISQSNQGVSVARNKGLSICTGEWFCFIDSDDKVDKDYLHRLYKEVDDQTDLILSGIKDVNYEMTNVISQVKLSSDNNIDRNDADGCYKLATLPLITSPVSKLYRTYIVKRNNVYFDKCISYGEDRDFNLKYISFVRKAKTIDYIGYNYRKNVEGSLSTNCDYIRRLYWDLDYWCKLNSYFCQNRCDKNYEIASYLIHRLYCFYNDNLLGWEAVENRSFKEVKRIIRDLISTDTFYYLKNNIRLIRVNWLIKAMFKIDYSWLYVMYYYMKFKRRNR